MTSHHASSLTTQETQPTSDIDIRLARSSNDMSARSTADISLANLENSRLLQLPQEILDLILGFIITPQLFQRVPYAWYLRRGIAFTQVCRKLRVDGGSLLFGRNFEFWGLGEGKQPLSRWIKIVAGNYRRHIRKLRNAMAYAESVEQATTKAAELDREHSLKQGTSWVLSYIPRENRTPGSMQLWINSSGEKDGFEAADKVLLKTEHLSASTGYSRYKFCI